MDMNKLSSVECSKFISDKLAGNCNEASLIEFFEKLPAESNRDFEKCLTELVTSVKDCVGLLNQIMRDKSLQANIRYAAFFALFSYYKRDNHPSELEKLLVEFKEEFSERGTYNHLYSMFLKKRARKGDLLAAIEYSEKAIKSIPENPGIIHSYVNSVISAIEEKELATYDDALIQDLLSKIKDAISKDQNYAKFYATKGRVCALKEDYVKAKESIREAMDKEQSDKRDYPIRMVEYQSQLIRVEREEALKAWIDKIAIAEKQIALGYEKIEKYGEQARTRNLEFLGFFVALVSFTIGSVHVAAQRPLLEAAQLIVTLSGALMLSFSGFTILLYGTSQKMRFISLFVIGGVVIIASLFFPKIL